MKAFALVLWMNLVFPVLADEAKTERDIGPLCDTSRQVVEVITLHEQGLSQDDALTRVNSTYRSFEQRRAVCDSKRIEFVRQKKILNIALKYGSLDVYQVVVTSYFDLLTGEWVVIPPLMQYFPIFQEDLRT